MITEDIKNINSSPKELRKFGISLGIVFLIWGVLFLWRGKSWYQYCFILSPLFIVLAFAWPNVLKPLQRLMAGLVIIVFAGITMIVLYILFYLVMTPIGVFARLCGKDFLDLRLNKDKTSYWVTRQEANFSKEHYERQF